MLWWWSPEFEGLTVRKLNLVITTCEGMNERAVEGLTVYEGSRDREGEGRGAQKKLLVTWPIHH